MKYNVISGDSHVDLHFMPEDMFVSNASAKWKDKMPHVVETEKGRRWQADGHDLGPAGTFRGTPGMSPEQQRRVAMMEESGLFDTSEGGYHPTTPELRIRDQEMDGVDAEVIYGLLDVSPGAPQGLSPEAEEQELKTEIFKIYNEWIADFCKTNPQRFAGLACIPNHDPKIAASELRRAAKLGLRGGEISVASMVKAVYQKDWDVLWAASHETGLPISFHTLEWWPRKIDDPTEAAAYDATYSSITVTMFQLSGVEYLASIIFSGACERFPNFKFVLGECGVSWLPYVLDRMDYEGEGQPGLTMKPSDYFHRQGYSTFERESIAGDVIHLIGEDNVIWGSDYPHIDGVWPYSQKMIENNLRNLKSETARHKVVCENAGKLYGFI